MGALARAGGEPIRETNMRDDRDTDTVRWRGSTEKRECQVDDRWITHRDLMRLALHMKRANFPPPLAAVVSHLLLVVMCNGAHDGSTFVVQKAHDVGS